VQCARNLLSHCPTRPSLAAKLRKSRRNFAALIFSCNVNDFVAVEEVPCAPLSAISDLIFLLFCRLEGIEASTGPICANKLASYDVFGFNRRFTKQDPNRSLSGAEHDQSWQEKATIQVEPFEWESDIRNLRYKKRERCVRSPRIL
jgi:hypothetical protein